MKSGLMLGVNPKVEREENDFYATNPKALEVFLQNFPALDISLPVWEPACGKGHLSDALKNKGFTVFSSDIIDRGYPELNKQMDFLTCDIKNFKGHILTNPPFKLAEDFIKKSLEIIEEDCYVIMFLKIQFLEGKERKKLFEKYPIKYVFCHSARQQCARDGAFEKYIATTQFYAWYVWQKGFSGDTILKWI